MRVRKRSSGGILEGDLTPMIDMTFQLIAFFMVLINFSQTEQNERIQLPESELAKPPDSPLESPITLHLTTEGKATQILRDHRDILEALLAGRGKAAEAAVRRHLSGTLAAVEEIRAAHPQFFR